MGMALSGVCSADSLFGSSSTEDLSHISTLSAFQTGVYHFYEKNSSSFKLGKKTGNAYRLSTSFSKGAPQYFSYGTTSDWTVRNGALQRPNIANMAKAASGNKVDVYRQGQSSGLSVELKAKDVSGKSLASYLKMQNGSSTSLSEAVSGWKKFPEGSVAYETTITSLRTEVIVPELNVFTGQKTVEGFVKTFSGKVPNCLRY